MNNSKLSIHKGIAVVRQYLLESIATACQDHLFVYAKEKSMRCAYIVAKILINVHYEMFALSYLSFYNQGENW